MLATIRTILALVLLVATAALAPAPAAALEEWDTFVPLGDGWQTYINSRFGVRFDYPVDVFSPMEPPENGGGRTFTSPDATLMIFAAHNTLDETPASMRREMVGSTDYENVTYSPSGDTWLVLSGFRGGDTIFYEKYFFRDGIISAFGMEFPKDRKPFYAPMIERIEDSFQAGRPD